MLKNSSTQPSNHTLGRSRGGFGTKVHLATDLNGIPLSIKLSAGQENEVKFAQPLLDSIAVQRKNGCLKRTPKMLLGDKAYASKRLEKSYAAVTFERLFLIEQTQSVNTMAE